MWVSFSFTLFLYFLIIFFIHFYIRDLMLFLCCIVEMKRWIGEDVGTERKKEKNGGTPLRVRWVYNQILNLALKIIEFSNNLESILQVVFSNSKQITMHFQIIFFFNLSYTYFNYQVTENKQTINTKEKTDYNPNNRSSETFRCVDLNKTWMLKKYYSLWFPLFKFLFFNSFTTSFNSKDQKKKN